MEVVGLPRGSTAEQGTGAETLRCLMPLASPASACGDTEPGTFKYSNDKSFAPELELRVFSWKQPVALIPGDIHGREPWSRG